jgi:hypothetical protein
MPRWLERLIPQLSIEGRRSGGHDVPALVQIEEPGVGPSRSFAGNQLRRVLLTNENGSETTVTVLEAERR